MLDQLEQLAASALSLEHWPFLTVMLVLAVMGQFTSKHVFTRERAYRQGRGQWFWWWARESLMVHPLATGALLGFFLWVDPEGHSWNRTASSAYFAGAGACSLFLFALLRGMLKKRGIKLTLPGESKPPPA
jgi:hypothetical protein